MQKRMACLLSWWAFTGAALLITVVWGTVQIFTNDPKSLTRHEGD